MAPAVSPAFKELREEQLLLNRFFWSSEVAFALVRQKSLSEIEMESTKPLRELLSPRLICNAFIPPSNHKQPSKYEATPKDFRGHLDINLAINSKFVILHFNRAFERFLRRRSRLEGLDGPQQTDLYRYLKRGASRDYTKWLLGINVQTSRNVPFEYFLDVRIYQEVRHDIAHADDESSPNFGAAPWSDKLIIEKCEKDAGWNHKRMFPESTLDERSEAIKRVCKGAQNSQSRSKTALDPEGQPLIFFYALFSLGAYRKLAKALEISMPPMKT